MNNIEKMIVFIRDNKILVTVLSVAIILIFSVIITNLNFQNLKTSTPVVSGTVYQEITRTNNLTFYFSNGFYYVVTKDPNKQNKSNIRATLNIPSNIDFEVLISPDVNLGDGKGPN